MIHQEPSTFANGTVLDERFELQELLGQGATGTVFRAKDLLMEGTEVALKLLHQHIAADGRSLARFRKEILVARSLQHPSVVETYELRLLGDALSFVVMEFVPGVSLETRLSAVAPATLPFVETLAVLRDIAAALAHAHNQGIIHRDLKPANVLIDADGRARLVDFGLARLLEDKQGLTRTGESLGTPNYMSPEQFRGLKAGKASDVYSFGLLAFELLTGRRPFTGDSYYSVAVSHLTDPLPVEELATNETPQWLIDLVITTTDKDPAQRKFSTKELSETLAVELKRIDEPNVQVPQQESHRSKSPYHVRTIRKRRKRLFSAVALSIVALAGLLAALRYLDGATYSNIVAPVLRLEQRLGFRFLPLRLIIAGVDLDLHDPQKMYGYILTSVDKDDSLTAARTLLKAGFDPNATYRGESLFLKACETGNRSALAFFNEAGVDSNTRDPSTGRYCLHKAALIGDTYRMYLISVFEWEATVQDHAGDTFLHLWSRMGQTESFRGDEATWNWMRPALKIRNNAGLTPLHLALQEPINLNKVKALLDLGADPLEPLPDQRTALDLAESSGTEELIALMHEAQERLR